MKQTSAITRLIGDSFSKICLELLILVVVDNTAGKPIADG